MKYELVEYSKTDDTCRFKITGRVRRRKARYPRVYTALDLLPLSDDLDGARFAVEHYIEHLEQIDSLPTAIIVGDNPQLAGVVQDYLGSSNMFKGELDEFFSIEDLKIDNAEDYGSNPKTILITTVTE